MTEDPTTPPKKSKGTIQLKKELGLFSAVSFILSIMIGSGIFVSPASALKYSGSVGMCLIVWATCGLISLLAFVYSWIMILVIRPAEVAILVLTFSQYLCQPIFDTLCMKDSADTDRVIKSLAIAALGNTTNLSKGFEGTTTSPKDFALAFYCVPIVTVLYLFMNVAYMAVLTQQEIITANDHQQAVAVLFGEKALGSIAFLIPLDGFMLESMCCVHHERLTPAPAVVLQGLISLMFILAGDIQELIEFASFLIWFFYGVAMVSLLILRKSMKNAHRPYKVIKLLIIRSF
nr:unnamed protein product [Callosobruchus analis]